MGNRQKSSYASVFFGLVLSAGCTASEDKIAAAEGPTWHNDVRPLVESSCTSCHTADGVGSFSLETYEDVAALKDQVADAVSNRRMPPWKAVDGCTDYRDNISLTDDEIAMVVEWAADGALEGDPTESRGGSAPETVGLDRVDLSLSLPLPYEVNTEVSDDYRCFPVEWPVEEDSYVTGYVVSPDRADLVHHMIAYIVPAGYADDLAALEAEDGQPGYECFGGPGPINQADAQWLGAWAPGAVQGPLPNGLGLKMEVGSLLVLQMHYNSASGATGTDQTSIDFTLEAEVDTVGWIQPFTNVEWVFGSGMEIPAGVDGVSHEYAAQVPRQLKFHTANMHMHTRGVSGGMSVEHSDGTEDCLIQIDDWDFDWQRSYVFDEPKVIEQGDTWSIQCSWDNPTEQDMAWGDGTGDEMCLGTVMVSLD
jgi:hypothetical protein